MGDPDSTHAVHFVAWLALLNYCVSDDSLVMMLTSSPTMEALFHSSKGTAAAGSVSNSVCAVPRRRAHHVLLQLAVLLHE